LFDFFVICECASKKNPKRSQVGIRIACVNSEMTIRANTHQFINGSLVIGIHLRNRNQVVNLDQSPTYLSVGLFEVETTNLAEQLPMLLQERSQLEQPNPRVPFCRAMQNELLRAFKGKWILNDIRFVEPVASPVVPIPCVILLLKQWLQEADFFPLKR
jgi:hypothetical protein